METKQSIHLLENIVFNTRIMCQYILLLSLSEKTIFYKCKKILMDIHLPSHFFSQHNHRTFLPPTSHRSFRLRNAITVWKCSISYHTNSHLPLLAAQLMTRTNPPTNKTHTTQTTNRAITTKQLINRILMIHYREHWTVDTSQQPTITSLYFTQ